MLVSALGLTEGRRRQDISASRLSSRLRPSFKVVTWLYHWHLIISRQNSQMGSCESGDLVRKLGLGTTPSGLLFRRKPLALNLQVTLEDLAQTHLGDTVNSGADRIAAILAPVSLCGFSRSFQHSWLIHRQAHLVLEGVGRGRLWDCSRARCWLASVGEGRGKGHVVRTEHHALTGSRLLDRGQRHMGKHTEVKGSLTPAGLQLAGQHLPDLIHPRCFNLGSRCLSQKRDGSQRSEKHTAVSTRHAQGESWELRGPCVWSRSRWRECPFEGLPAAQD